MHDDMLKRNLDAALFLMHTSDRKTWRVQAEIKAEPQDHSGSSREVTRSGGFVPRRSAFRRNRSVLAAPRKRSTIRHGPIPRLAGACLRGRAHTPIPNVVNQGNLVVFPDCSVSRLNAQSLGVVLHCPMGLRGRLGGPTERAVCATVRLPIK